MNSGDTRIFCGGHRGGKMRFWWGKNQKICPKLLILAIFSFWWGRQGGAEPLTGGGANAPMPPLIPPLGVKPMLLSPSTTSFNQIVDQKGLVYFMSYYVCTVLVLWLTYQHPDLDGTTPRNYRVLFRLNVVPVNICADCDLMRLCLAESYQLHPCFTCHRTNPT